MVVARAGAAATTARWASLLAMRRYGTLAFRAGCSRRGFSKSADCSGSLLLPSSRPKPCDRQLFTSTFTSLGPARRLSSLCSREVVTSGGNGRPVSLVSRPPIIHPSVRYSFPFSHSASFRSISSTPRGCVLAHLEQQGFEHRSATSLSLPPSRHAAFRSPLSFPLPTPTPVPIQIQTRSYQPRYSRPPPGSQTSYNYGPQGYRHGGRFPPPRNTRPSIFRRWVTSPYFFYHVAFIALLSGAYYVSNLEVVPITGRKRFNIVSPEWEAEFAKDQFESTIREFRGKILPRWDPRVRFCRGVLNRLVRSAGLDGESEAGQAGAAAAATGTAVAVPGEDGKVLPISGRDGSKVEWELYVIDAPIPNAFVIPGGKVFVFTGILPLCQSESALATVLGHEIAHTLARHSAERLSKATPLLAVNYVASLMLGIPPLFTSWLVEMAFLMPGSRAQESEADYIGLLMMAQACYDPREAIPFWTRMERLSQQMGQNVPEFLSTHPSNENRITDIAKWLPEAEAVRKNSNCNVPSTTLLEFWHKLGHTRF